MKDSELIMSEMGALERLQVIVRQLRAPGGCPWDAEQTHESLLPHLIEEAYEVVHAIRSKDEVNLQEELGDLLLQVVFHALLMEEKKLCNLDDIAQSISEKLIRRHPHVFSDAQVLDTEAVLSQWDAIKRQEKGESAELPYLHKIGDGLPSLLVSKKLQKKVAKIGFDWKDAEGVMSKIEEELLEVRHEIEVGNESALDEELGDLLFSCVNLIRKLGRDPEVILCEANEKFRTRFSQMEQVIKEEGASLMAADSTQMEKAWEKVKSRKI